MKEKKHTVAMAGEREESQQQGKTLVVGVRMDQQSRELLTWSLVNLASPGDHVIALHAAAAAPSSASDHNSCSFDATALLSLINEFHSMIAVYEGFCNLKQIDLKLKVSRGSSVRKILVQEAKSLAASVLALGVAKIGPFSVSVAKFCAKKLPADCAVVAVNNGKIVFQRDDRLLLKLESDHHSFSSSAAAIKDSDNCSVCTTPSSSCRWPRSAESREEEETLIPESPAVSASPLISDLRGARSRWPLLGRARRFPASPAVHPDTKHTKPASNARIPKEFDKYSSVCRLFSYEELVQATSNLSPDNIIGKGGSSCVYKGRLPDGKELAVKILKPSEDALQEFVSEVEIITTLHHKNIVSLVGFCVEEDNLVLVYDFLSRGSLEEFLHGEKENKNVLSWIDRYKIAVGVAEALDYLHCGGDSQPVIHRDVKSSNILLPDDFEPQLCDFGIARWASASSTHITHSDVAGTFGYLAPDYFMYGKVNEKVDVYAFGVVLLELISGRKPVSTQCPKGLVMWAKPILQGGKVKQLVDPILGDDYDNDQMEKMTLAASLCIRRSARYRPCIARILKLLQGGDDVLKWARLEISGGSEEFFEWDDDDETSTSPYSNIQSHINLALLDIDDEETTSVSSVDHSIDFIAANTSLEEYLQGRWSGSSSFD